MVVARGVERWFSFILHSLSQAKDWREADVSTFASCSFAYQRDSPRSACWLAVAGLDPVLEAVGYTGHQWHVSGILVLC